MGGKGSGRTVCQTGITALLSWRSDVSARDWDRGGGGNDDDVGGGDDGGAVGCCVLGGDRDGGEEASEDGGGETHID